MNAARKIKKILRSKQTSEGAGVHLRRAFGFSEIGQFDPFLLLDDFRSGNPNHYSKGFPWHPHRGIETITYYEHPAKPGHTVFAYVIAGQGYFCKAKKPFTYEAEGENYCDMETDPLASNGTLILFEDGRSVHIETGDASIRFLLISGKPLNEPIAWHGPIVMNNQAELQLAFDEYRAGTFLKNKSKA